MSIIPTDAVGIPGATVSFRATLTATSNRYLADRLPLDGFVRIGERTVDGQCSTLLFMPIESDGSPKAWAMYGRSPVAGAVLYAHDLYDDGGLESRPPLDDAWIALLRTDFVRSPMLNVDLMRSICDKHRLAWPEPKDNED